MFQSVNRKSGIALKPTDEATVSFKTYSLFVGNGRVWFYLFCFSEPLGELLAVLQPPDGVSVTIFCFITVWADQCRWLKHDTQIVGCVSYCRWLLRFPSVLHRPYSYPEWSCPAVPGSAGGSGSPAPASCCSGPEHNPQQSSEGDSTQTAGGRSDMIWWSRWCLLLTDWYTICMLGCVFFTSVIEKVKKTKLLGIIMDEQWLWSNPWWHCVQNRKRLSYQFSYQCSTNPTPSTTN